LLDAVLRLSETLIGTRQGGLLADALHAVLAAIDCARGAAYATIGDALVLVGERGLPAELRASLHRLSLTEPPWFIAQRAAQARSLCADRALAGSGGQGLDGALAAAGWAQAVACPIVAEREVLGVLVIAASRRELGAPAAATLRIACNLMALQMSRASVDQRLDEHRSGDARAARLAAFGLLAGGFAGEIEPALTALEEGLAAQQRLVERLRGPEAEELAELAARSAERARSVRESAGRLHAAVRSGTVAERLDLGRLVGDALALVGPALRSRRIELHAACPEGHFIVGRRGELLQLFMHVLLNVAGVGDEENPAKSRPRSLDVRLYRHEANEVLSIDDPGEDVVSTRTRLLASPAIVRRGGQGLGFAAARQIVIAHRGHIALDPSDAGGVRCEVALPAEGAFVEIEPRAVVRNATPTLTSLVQSTPAGPEQEVSQKAIGRITVPEPAALRSLRMTGVRAAEDAGAEGPSSRPRAASDLLVEPAPVSGSRSDPRFAPTEPRCPAAPGRDAQLTAMASAIAATLRREGPKRGATVLEMLHRRGLSESEALAVVTVALSTGALVRDPPWSNLLCAPEPPAFEGSRELPEADEAGVKTGRR
jgi:nitrogen-specific signal transduction histidine kinase